jgi:protein SCO1
MTCRAIAIGLTCLMLVAHGAWAQERYTVTGMVLETNPAQRTFTASIDAIPHFMAAMTMPFTVRDAAELAEMRPGTMVIFTLVVDRARGGASYAEGLRVRTYQNVEQDPSRARRLELFRQISRGTAARTLQAGAAVPDFTLTDSRHQKVTLSNFRGRIVAVNFMYTTCQLPDYCLRMVNHFSALQRRFAGALGRDLVFLTMSFDPQRDTPEVLADYAKQWKPDLNTWHFLTGPVQDVQPVLEMFGVSAFAAEGLFDHALHTVLIGRDGRLIVNLEGNQFTTNQLGDLIASALARR